MKFRRNQLILLFAIITIIGLVYSMRRDNYKFTRKEVRDSLLEHIEIHEEADMIYVSQMMDAITIDDKLKDDIYKEADKADLADKNKLVELIKKI